MTSHLEQQRQNEYGQGSGKTSVNQESVKHAREGANRIDPRNKKAERSARRKIRLEDDFSDVQGMIHAEISEGPTSRLEVRLPILPDEGYVAVYKRNLKPSLIDSQTEERRLAQFHAQTMKKLVDSNVSPMAKGRFVLGSQAYVTHLKEDIFTSQKSPSRK